MDRTLSEQRYTMLRDMLENVRICTIGNMNVLDTEQRNALREQLASIAARLVYGYGSNIPLDQPLEQLEAYGYGKE